MISAREGVKHLGNRVTFESSGAFYALSQWNFFNNIIAPSTRLDRSLAIRPHSIRMTPAKEGSINIR